MPTATATKQLWEESFAEQIERQAYNTSPVEALVRSISYYLRDRYTVEQRKSLHFLELGCGAAPNLLWLAQKGITISGLDISPTALKLARQNLHSAGVDHLLRHLLDGSVTRVPLEAESCDGIIEACVFQHLDRSDRVAAFREVKRLLKPGGLFVGYMLDAGHSVFQQHQGEQLPDDSGTLRLSDGRSKIYLTNVGLCHFYRKEEFYSLLEGFSVVDPCLTTYFLPREESERRGYTEYLQSMWTVYAIK
jgi:SAM-dependent methyltransferase